MSSVRHIHASSWSLLLGILQTLTHYWSLRILHETDESIITTLREMIDLSMASCLYLPTLTIASFLGYETKGISPILWSMLRFCHHLQSWSHIYVRSLFFPSDVRPTSFRARGTHTHRERLLKACCYSAPAPSFHRSHVMGRQRRIGHMRAKWILH